MKTRSIALATAQSLGTTSLCWAYKATRTDGTILTVNDSARDFLFDGYLYESLNGFIPKAISQEASAAVMNTEIAGALSDAITEDDLEDGLWDGCTVEMVELNFRDLSMGAMKLATFTMGEIQVNRSSFNVAMRGLTERLQKIVGRLVTKGCPWRFGDPDTCRKDLGPLTVSGVLTGVINGRTFADSSRTEIDNYFGNGGVFTFTSGACEGESLEVYTFAHTGGVFTTHLQLNHNPAVGDTYTVYPGCAKDFTRDCVATWANGDNHGGFDALPGPDKMLGLGGMEGSSQ